MDPEISAAFSGSSTPPPHASSSDPEIASAFGSQPVFKQAPAWMIKADQPLQGMGTVATQTAGQLMGAPGKALTGAVVRAGITNPYIAASIGVLPDLAEDVLGGAGRGAPEDLASPMADVGEIQAKLDAAAASSPQSMGASAAAPRITAATPELQQAVVQAARRNGGAVNANALSRQLQADSLPVPVRLTEGQATQDPQLLSLEQNGRGANPVLANHFQQQNQALVQNLQTIRDQVGPDVFSGNPIEHGDALIQAYQDKGAAADADIAAKYQDFANSTGGAIDQSGVLARLEAQFRQEKVWNQEGTQKVMNSLSDIAQNPNMTADELEAYQTSLARTIRSTSDGHEAYAAGQAKSALYDIPVDTGAQTSQQVQLGMAARGAAKAQFDAIAADPAYDAAINGKVPPDRFVSRFVTGPSATRDGISTMRQNLAGNDTAQQTIGVAGVDQLRAQAGIDPMGNGNFSQAGYNKTYQTLQARGVFDPQTSETLGNIGDVARATQFQPRGSFVNNSNTLVGALGQTGANLAEHGVNMAAHGLPIGTIARQVITGRSAAKAAQRAVAPGAGIDRIDLP